MAVAVASTADPAGVTAVSSVTNYTVSTGTATTDRIVAVAVHRKVAQTILSVTIDPGQGTPILAMGLRASAIQSTMGAFIYDTLVTVGSTASVAILWTGAVTSLQNHITVFKITGADTAAFDSEINGQTDMDASNPLTVAVTTPAGGAALAAVAGAASASGKGWVGLSVSSDAGTGAGGFRYTDAFSTSPSATITCTGSTNLEDGALACVVYQVAGGLKKPLSLTMQPLLTQ